MNRKVSPDVIFLLALGAFRRSSRPITNLTGEAIVAAVGSIVHFISGDQTSVYNELSGYNKEHKDE